MRTEFVIVIKEDGKKNDYCRYGGRKWAEEKYNQLMTVKETRRPNIIVEMYKEHYIGNSFHDRERLH